MDPSSLAAAGGGVLNNLAQLLGKKFGEAWTHTRWLTAETDYRKKLATELGQMSLFGSNDPVQLSELFTEAFFLPSASAQQRVSAESLRAIVEFEQVANIRASERIEAFEVARSAHRLFVLGTPGSGKSTFLKQIAIAAATRSTRLLPIFISLKDWAESNLSFFDFACREFDVCGFPDARPVLLALLESGSAFLLLDGLDEVQTFNSVRERAINEVLLLSRKYEKSRLFITCRTSSNDYVFSSFKYVEMADFQQSQQDSFVKKWFSRSPPKLAAIQHELKQPSASRLRDLARKPLLLAFLCIVFDQLQEFPSSRSSIYEEAIDVLLKEWDSSRKIKRETYAVKGISRKKQLLARLALRTFELERFVFPSLLIEGTVSTFLQHAPGSDYKEDVEVEELLRSIEYAHGIIVERAVGLFSFSHLSIHEYLSAVGLVNRHTSGATWTELLPPDRVAQARWRDVIVHIASLLPEADLFLAHLRKCAAAISEQSPTLARLIRLIDAVASDEKSFSRLYATPELFFNSYGGLASTGTGHFVASQALRTSLDRLMGYITSSINAERQAGRSTQSSSLLPAWRRAVVLQQLFALPRAIPLLVGKVEQNDMFDKSFTMFLGFHELCFELASQAMVERKGELREGLLRIAD